MRERESNDYKMKKSFCLIIILFSLDFSNEWMNEWINSGFSIKGSLQTSSTKPDINESLFHQKCQLIKLEKFTIDFVSVFCVLVALAVLKHGVSSSTIGVI